MGVTLMQEAPEVAEEKVVEAEEEEEGGDFDDPLAMLGGMADEEVYKVTLMAEAPDPNASAEEECVVEAEEEYDPLAMLGGMADEEVYKVTLMEEAPAADTSAEVEEAEDVDFDDPLAMLG